MKSVFYHHLKTFLYLQYFVKCSKICFLIGSILFIFIFFTVSVNLLFSCVSAEMETT